MSIENLFQQRFSKIIGGKKYEENTYTHFDPPFKINTRKKRIKKEFLNIDHVIKHAFYPFINTKFNIIKYTTKLGKRKWEPKERNICYAGHYDSLLLSWYAHFIGHYYDTLIRDKGINHSVIAYRKLSKFDERTNQSRGLSNIDFAKEVFEYIANKGECIALTFDIEKFFDTLDRKILKSNRKRVLGVDELPQDHYHLFKILTLFQSIEKRIIDEKLNIFGKKKKFEAKQKGYIFNQDRWRVLKDTFYKNNLVKNNLENGKGIPQGSAMSAILSNLYMIDFDIHFSELAKKYNALYKRYSDDITIICSVEDKKKFIDEMYEQIAGLNLVIQKKKEDRTVFKYNEKGVLTGYYDMEDEKNIERNSKGKFLCVHKRNKSIECLTLGCNFDGKCITIPKKIQYLGFLFDGTDMEIRPSSMSNYHQKMITGVKKVVYQAKGKQGKGNIVFKQKLLSKFTHLGKSNFITYVKRAQEITGSKRIKKQYKRHMAKFLGLINRYY